MPDIWQLNGQWNVKWAVTKPILKYCPPCIEDINNGQYLNILIPAWPVTPTRRGNSHRIVPAPIITNYWQKLVCPPALCKSRHSNTIIPNWTNSKHVKWSRCPRFLPMKYVVILMWGPINMSNHVTHVRTYQYCRTRWHRRLALTLGAISWIPSTSNICLIGQISHNWSNIWEIIKIFSMYGKVFPIMFFFRVISDCEAHHLVFSISNLSSLKCCCRSLSIFCYLKSKMSKDDQLS